MAAISSTNATGRTVFLSAVPALKVETEATGLSVEEVRVVMLYEVGIVLVAFVLVAFMLRVLVLRVLVVMVLVTVVLSLVVVLVVGIVVVLIGDV